MNAERVRERLEQLATEKAKGEQLLAKLEAECADLRAQLLRIGGAIQVCEELLADGDGEPDPPP